MNQALEKFVQFAQKEKATVDGILECIGDGLSLQSTDYKVVYQNSALKNMMGDHVGEPCYAAYHGRDSLCLDCQVDRVFRDGETHRAERTVPTPDGTAVVAITASPIKDASGQVVGAVEVVRDVTEAKKAEREREELIGRLEKAATEIRTLRGILPICSHCKCVRNDEGYYERIEAYLQKRSGVDFSHTICPDCYERHYSEV